MRLFVGGRREDAVVKRGITFLPKYIGVAGKNWNPKYVCTLAEFSNNNSSSNDSVLMLNDIKGFKSMTNYDKIIKLFHNFGSVLLFLFIMAMCETAIFHLFFHSNS